LAPRHCLHDAGTYDLPGTKIIIIRPKYKKAVLT